MDAIVVEGFESFSVEDVDRPEPREGEVVIDVSRVQLSVTECLLYRGREIAHYDAVERSIHAEGGARLFGHEFCGEVVECGPAVEAFGVGDRVYAPGKIHCGSCPYCRAGYANYCPDTTSIGSIGRERSRSSSGSRPGRCDGFPTTFPTRRAPRSSRWRVPSSVPSTRGSTPATTCSSSA
ncbi:alcohol dehydrogenase catalytic domain-containing protein [Halalkalicoccus sp. NIPERK01]|uniref:alcohol dehydrogenase catalytic domain-containing protein n=1 Tax=Halalkalicoccus sp. NIPERK01 TaxID=3053469 RepID=UPI00256F65A6|nr:alcohol dehydrogenase catalytic domain-containing protein [Halalkalicoccus sp. NIPERK01]MDL5363455.1 alcohol dehydrogenase catalytic domain-containing protein [Halalkalicoccus sp. NIPERK01]